MFKRLPTWIVALALVALITPANVFAHGEAGDEPFLKDLTTAFYDVKISPNVIHVGEPVTITGKVRVLDTWPYTLDPPQTAYITPVVPGPVFALQDRTVNGQSAPGSFFVERNGGQFRELEERAAIGEVLFDDTGDGGAGAAINGHTQPWLDGGLEASPANQ